mmetsp:Transcript_26281/g.59909  ORF Transcript_26281/g.59909 Transcript_26281/m.59909 type:complete len:365 (-) Transcript_26281:283-1377(-)
MGGLCGKSAKQEAPIEAQRRRLSVSQADQVKTQGDDSKGLHAVATGNDVMDLFPNTGRKMSIGGAHAAGPQKGFENKKVELMGDKEILATNHVGFACKKGLKPESPNQDDFFILQVDDWGMYGVFDGHGPCGHDVSLFVNKMLPGQILRDSAFETKPDQAFTTAFKATHNLMQGEKCQFDASLSGTTCTVVLHRAGMLHAAHAGDSRAVLARKQGGKWVAEDLTPDHKPELDGERKRIQSSGGEVRKLAGDIPHRVFAKGKMYPGLAMSRSLGDNVAHTVGVSEVPDVVSVKVTEEAKFAIVCSDGVWEFISSQEAVDMVAKFGKAHVQDATDSLCKEAWKRWIDEEGNVVDDITAIVVWLNDA